MWICLLDCFEQMAYHFNSRDVCEGMIPIMGTGKPKGIGYDGRPVKDSVEDAKKDFIAAAKEELGLILDSPTAGNSAGNSGIWLSK